MQRAIATLHRPASGQTFGGGIYSGTKVFGGTPNTARETRTFPMSCDNRRVTSDYWFILY